MKISYKAVYHLLETKYHRRSLNYFIETDLSEGVYDASLIFAHMHEDYKYLSVMVENRDINDADFVFFTNLTATHPIIISKNEHLSLGEFAILEKKCDSIDQQHFLDVIEAQAQGLNIEAPQEIAKFKAFQQVIAATASEALEDGMSQHQNEDEK